MLQPHADARADKGKACTHHARQAYADRSHAAALDDGDDARAQQSRIDQGHDLVGRQLERTAEHQRHGDDAAQRGEQMLQRKQRGGDEAGRTVFHPVKQFFHGLVSCFLGMQSPGNRLPREGHKTKHATGSSHMPLPIQPMRGAV